MLYTDNCETVWSDTYWDLSYCPTTVYLTTKLALTNRFFLRVTSTGFSRLEKYVFRTQGLLIDRLDKRVEKLVAPTLLLEEPVLRVMPITLIHLS